MLNDNHNYKRNIIYGYACRADKNPYRHNRRADKNSYRHDRRADKNPYLHDRCADSQSLPVQCVHSPDTTAQMNMHRSRVRTAGPDPPL